MKTMDLSLIGKSNVVNSVSVKVGGCSAVSEPDGKVTSAKLSG